MQLPLELQHFPSATLLVTSDSVSAKFRLIKGKMLRELDDISLPHEQNQGSERPSMSSDGTRLGGSDAPDDGPRLQRYIHHLVDRIGYLVREHTITHIYLVMPTHIERVVVDHLPHDISAKILKHIDVDAMSENPLSVVRRILNA